MIQEKKNNNHDSFSDHHNKFHYLNQGQSLDVPGVDDLEYFEETLNALRLLEFTENDQNDMLKILASVLHLGNITFHECIIETENEHDQEGCKIEVSLLLKKTHREVVPVLQRNFKH